MKKLLFVVFAFLLTPLYSSLSLDQLGHKTSGITVEVMASEKSETSFIDGFSWWVKDDKDDTDRVFYIHGFFLNDQGYVLTCKSFLEGKENIQVQWVNKKGYSRTDEAVLIAEHPTEDMAILRVETTNVSKFPSGDLSYKNPIRGSDVFMSYPEIDEHETYHVLGQVLDIIKYGSVHNLMVAIPSFCSRGLPVFDTNGTIIGIQKSSYIKHDFVCCLPLIYLQDWIEGVIGK